DKRLRLAQGKKVKGVKKRKRREVMMLQLRTRLLYVQRICSNSHDSHESPIPSYIMSIEQVQFALTLCQTLLDQISTHPITLSEDSAITTFRARVYCHAHCLNCPLNPQVTAAIGPGTHSRPITAP